MTDKCHREQIVKCQGWGEGRWVVALYTHGQGTLRGATRECASWSSKCKGPGAGVCLEWLEQSDQQEVREVQEWSWHMVGLVRDPKNFCFCFAWCEKP